MSAAACTRLMHYLMDSYFGVWLYGVPDPFLKPTEEEWDYYLQWPTPWFFMWRITPLLSALGFWRGHPSMIYLAWSWSWRFWDPLEFDGKMLTKEQRRMRIRRAFRRLLTGRELL